MKGALPEHHSVVKKSTLDQDEVLVMLREQFSAAQLEKYDTAVMNMLFDDGVKKFRQGNKRVGDHVLRKVQKYMIEHLRSMYGPYLTVLRKKDRFFFNFSMVYKTQRGRLYQSTTYPDLFITSHALERYEERMPDLETLDLASGINTLFRNKWGTSPTAYDSLDDILRGINEYGVPVDQGDTLILNLTFGFLVLDVFEKFSVAKTFLLPGMNVPKCEWFERQSPITVLDATVLEDSVPIDQPFLFVFQDGMWRTNE